MAYIDKIFLKTYKAYTELLQWLKQADIEYREMLDEHGIERFSEWFRDDYTEEVFNDMVEAHGEIYVANTWCFVDAMLIRYCPIEEVQERLKFMYSSSYESIKDGTDSIWAPMLECKCNKVQVIYPHTHFHQQRPHYYKDGFILDDYQCGNEDFFYECADRKWRSRNKYCGKQFIGIERFTSVKAAVRYLRKNVPKGLTFWLLDSSTGDRIVLKTK